MRFYSIGFVLGITLGAAAATPSRDQVIAFSGCTEIACSMLSISNPSEETANINVAFLPVGKPREGKPLTLAVPPRQTRTVGDVDGRHFGIEASAGALRIRSNVPVLAYTLTAGRGTFEGIPTEYAVGTRDTTFVTGASFDRARFVLHVVEIKGLPLFYGVTLYDRNGREIGMQRYYTPGGNQRQLELQAEFAGVKADGVLVRVQAIHGDGKLVAQGMAHPHDGGQPTGHTMTLAVAPRARLRRGEIVLYTTLAFTILIAALVSRRNVQNDAA